MAAFAYSNAWEEATVQSLGRVVDGVGERRGGKRQPGDAPATCAEASLLERLTGYQPATDFRQGIETFVRWFRD